MDKENKIELIFAIDTSGSMYGDKIAAVWAALNETINSVRGVIRDYKAQVDVYYMTFDSSFSEMQQINVNEGFPKFEIKTDENGFYKLSKFEALYSGMLAFAENRKVCSSGLILITDGKINDPSSNYSDKVELINSLRYRYLKESRRIVACVNKESEKAYKELIAFVNHQADRVFDIQKLSLEVETLCKSLLSSSGDEFEEETRFIFG